MDSSERMLRLVQKMLLLSKEGKIKWDPTADEDLFLTTFPEYSVSVTGGDTSPALRLHNSEGRLIEGYSPEPYGSSHNALVELFSEARRSALGLDQALDNIFARLEKIAS